MSGNNQTVLFVGEDLTNRIGINEKDIPSKGGCINIKNLPFIKDGKYSVVEKDSMRYDGVLYPRILVEHTGDTKSYLYTLDFSNVEIKQG